MKTAPRLLALGDSAWTLEFGNAIDPAINARVMGLADQLALARGTEALLSSVTDVVPTFRSLTVHYNPVEANAAVLGERLLVLARQACPATQPGRLWHLPVCFDADFAPDLPGLAEAKGLSPGDAIERLLDARFRVYMLGFQPGFPYMGGVPSELQMPRLPVPRQKVPAQSVAVAGAMCSVYPWESPGGWHLVGRTPVVLFDLRYADHPAMLGAGDEVRWYAVDRQTHDALAAEIAQGLPRETFLKALHG
ncbi:MAG: allophanate hydrolase subunit 1 [Hydrogenophaga sp.]|uniref:5-oxoprolinase subunit B family protein n=1 Tax=Hydrogenophaga sp. TaxID=1904254 RepID=UPI001BC1F8CF|nr:allophanate hydrolase subunit 1 [Hydrogenophaga sp.]MBS3912641.1 allophanate hydrolase subunit 1 [Hydrogenophaga sp.]MDO9147526.1 allophanate hydrolase subunit 1 [Hydrogenophaga sp.]MDO9604755.1 allophanate hydrolase subunit 1 [Hydrogenophaga sp.]